jgi:hypothetical protein
VVSMRDLFPACRQVLEEERCPLHYAELTRRALRRLGLHAHGHRFHKLAEDVREKLLLARRRGTFYTGAPFYAGALRHWFVAGQGVLLNADTILIPGNAASGVKGLYEGLMRHEHMLHKNKQASPSTVARGRARGLVIEHHVADWFAAQWPELFVPPANAGQYEEPCDHDFALRVEGRMYQVDVFGPRRDGTFANPGKAQVNFHLACRIEDQDVVWEAVVPGSQFNAEILPVLCISPVRMTVWLNCVQAGLDYESIKAKAA